MGRPCSTCGTVLGILAVALLVAPGESLNCTSQKFINKEVYPNCADLPNLSAHLHWSYNEANSSLSVAFVAPPAKPGGWVAWAINPNLTGMSGSQALLAYPSNDTITIQTFNIRSYDLDQSRLKLIYEVWDLSAELSGGTIKIFGKWKLPSRTEKVNQVWQVGSGMDAGGYPMVHDFKVDNVNAKGILQLVNQEATATTPASAGSALAPAPTGASTVGSQRFKVMIVAIIATSSAGIGLVMVVICYFRRKFPSYKIIYFWKKESLTHQTIQAFLRNHGPLTIKRYSYSDVKKITNFFNEKLGEGGYGGVYKGKLQNGCFVAVKVLKELRGNGEEFINEVASISRTSHVNIVSLIGFSFEGSKRALVYEFMPNGSLDKFIYKESPSIVDRRLKWDTLYKIALGIARGLEYLHRGCNTRILHFDIKPHNILLDETFCPKISDFGLAKICPREKSIISMLGARGTAGYIAPEVFCRSFGGVSHKSDVYSYGMMVFEMVGGRRNIDAEIDHTSEIFFPHWIYKRLEQEEDLGLEGLLNEDDHESARKMIIVSLWCIQTDPSSRPPMSKVVNLLEGSLESLQVPPKPFLSSPTRSPEDSSTTVSLQYDSLMP